MKDCGDYVNWRPNASAVEDSQFERDENDYDEQSNSNPDTMKQYAMKRLSHSGRRQPHSQSPT